MHPTCMTSIRNWTVAFCLPLLVARTGAAQFVEVTADVDSTCWPAQGGETHSALTVKCIVSTNSWMIDGSFARNGTATFWFTGTNLIQHTVVTKGLRQEDNGWTPSQVGQTATHFRVSDGGRPDGLGLWNVVWLAFCSGNYLKAPLPIVLPIGVFNPVEYSQNYRQTISTFEDELALPRHLDVYTSEKTLVCRYEAEESTSFEGWRFPERFKLVQYRAAANGTWTPYLSVVGRLTSTHSVGEPKIPTDVLKEITQ